MNRIYLCFGSNIHPKDNLQKAMILLNEEVEILSSSKVWETEAVGSSGPKFLNQIVLISSDLTAKEIKEKILRKIEMKLGRIRTKDKNAPRTIDIDIIIFNHEVVEEDIWKEAYIALPLAELCPDLINKQNGKKLIEIAGELGAFSNNRVFNN